MSAKPKPGETPTVVAIHQGKVHAVVEERLQRILQMLPYDPDLNFAAATGALLSAAADLTARLQ
eukprot:9120336-Prorocentrum_lima.AAC.1